MSVITPSSDLYLLHSPLEADMNHQLNFANATAQTNYFLGLTNKFLAEDFTYIRKDEMVKVEACMDDIITYNYMMYKNTAFGDKWIYAFITHMEFLSPNVTAVYFKTDTWQTWQFNIQIKKCFVEREHVSDDTVGAHTIPEGLDCGEYVCNGVVTHNVASPSSNTYICMQFSTPNIDTGGAYILPSSNTVYSGIPQGCCILGIPYTDDGVTTMRTIIGMYDGAGRSEAILSIFLVPQNCTAWTEGSMGGSSGTGMTFASKIYIPSKSTSSASGTISGFIAPVSLNGYTPKNGKMFCYPYNYLYVTNNNGGDVVYHYEDFVNNVPSFKWYATLEQGGCVYIAPNNSKKASTESTSVAWNEGLSCGKLPQLSWTSDYYLNWQALNASNIEVQTTLDAINWGASAIGSMGQGGSGALQGVTSLASSVANTMQQVKQAKMIPDQAKGNINSGDITYASGQICYKFRNMCVRSEVAAVIDGYFSMFGYKVNSVKVPNITGRTNWNYVKLHDANIIGNIPQPDMQDIKNMFHKGVTIWHNPTTFLDYSQNNNIIV